MIQVQTHTEGGYIVATFPFDRETIAAVKRAGMRHHPTKDLWYAPDNAQTRMLLDRELKGEAEVKAAAPWANYVPRPHLMQHQRAGVELAKEKSRWLYAYDCGTGKTVLAIEIIRMKGLKTLVVCPLSIIEHAWMKDIEQFDPALRAVNLWSLWKASKRRGGETAYANALNNCDVAIVNFQGFGSQKEILSQAGFGMVITDESSMIKTPKAGITKDLTKFCEDIPNVYLMSGTPAPNSEQEYFSQIRIIDPTVFGKSEWKFRNQWFFQAGFKWIMFQHKRQEFNDRLAKCMSSVSKDDVLDLPPQTWNIRAVELSAAENKAYKEMIKDLVAVVEDKEISAANAAVKIMKLRQITSGFLFDEEGHVTEFGDSKLKALQELLEEIGRKSVLIWAQFQHEAQKIKKLLGDKVEIINGEIPQGERGESITRFKAGELQYLCCHPKSMGHGHTMTNSSYAVYYSMDHSYESWKQSADRIHRYGQTKGTTYYSLIAPGTIDEVIYKCLHNKGEVSRAVLDYVKGVKK